jgi:hypothetical protein
MPDIYAQSVSRMAFSFDLSDVPQLAAPFMSLGKQKYESLCLVSQLDLTLQLLAKRPDKSGTEAPPGRGMY